MPPLVQLVQGSDALLAVDDLETFTAEPGSFLLDVVKIDEWNRIAAQDGVYEFLLLGSRPDNSTLILRIHDEHLLRLQVQHIAHLEIVWLSLHRAMGQLTLAEHTGSASVSSATLTPIGNTREVFGEALRSGALGY